MKLDLIFFKKIFSHLFDIQVDAASTALNPVLNLSLRKGRYYLTTTNAVYSFGDLYDNFSKTFERMDFGNRKYPNLLVLGFALGSVPYMLERVFGQKFKCTGVELDPKIATWARHYTIPTINNPIELVQSDAFEFMEHNHKKFDLIVVDLFLDDVVPSQFESPFFLQRIADSLSIGGLLLYNRLADTTKAINSTNDFFLGNFKDVFPEGNYLDVGGNWMLANRAVWA